MWKNQGKNVHKLFNLHPTRDQNKPLLGNFLFFFLTQKLFTEVNLQNTKCRQLSLQTTKYEKNTRIMP